MADSERVPVLRSHKLYADSPEGQTNPGNSFSGIADDMRDTLDSSNRRGARLSGFRSVLPFAFTGASLLLFACIRYQKIDFSAGSMSLDVESNSPRINPSMSMYDDDDSPSSGTKGEAGFKSFDDDDDSLADDNDAGLETSRTGYDDDAPLSTMFLKYAVSNYEPAGVCLDGSQPGFWFRKGFGHGKKRWLIHLKGGGWCESETDCAEWVEAGYQSGSGDLPHNITGEGLQSIVPHKNPNYFDWNAVYVNYCDGGSYSGYLHAPVMVGQTQIYVRGKQAFISVIKTLLNDYNMDKAIDIVLAGTSAGALGVQNNCDMMAEMVSGAKFGCIMDAGFFHNSTNFGGKVGHYTDIWEQVVKTHNMIGYMDVDCENTETHPWKCILADTALKYVSTKIFLIQSTVDYWQLTYNYFYEVKKGLDCLNSPITGCTPNTFAGLQDFRTQTLQAIHGVVSQNENISMFVDACFAHSQTDTTKLFTYPVIVHVTISMALTTWWRSGHMRQLDGEPWPHKEQQCAWGPEWNAFVNHSTFTVEYEDFISQFVDESSLR